MLEQAIALASVGDKFILSLTEGFIPSSPRDKPLASFYCQFGGNIWNNSERDPAALHDAAGNVIDRR